MNATKMRKDSLTLRGKRPSAKAYSANFLKEIKLFMIVYSYLEKQTNTLRPVEENLLWQTNARDKVRSDEAVR